MEKMLAIVLAGIAFFIFGFNTLTEARPMKNEALNAKQQEIVAISAFTAQGDLEKLKTALNHGLDAGLTVNEIREILVQLYAYTGFPRSLNGLDAFMVVLKEREGRGVKDAVGREPSPFPADKSGLELGTEIQTRLIGAPAKGAVFEFAPAIDVFLKAHLFGDIFGRDNLDFQSREIATISALAALGGAESQLRSHFGIGMNTGLAEAQLRGLTAVLESRVGKNEGVAAQKVLDGVLSSRKGS